MIDHRNNAPRRYFVDPGGHRVLIGLSSEETAEFEALDGIFSHGEGRGTIGDGGASAVAPEARWLELYTKHDAAWAVWIAQSRAEQTANSTFVNYG